MAEFLEMPLCHGLDGVQKVEKLLGILAGADDDRLSSIARARLEGLARRIISLHEEIGIAERCIPAWHCQHRSKRSLTAGV